MTAPVLLAAVVMTGILGYTQGKRAIQGEARRHVLAVHQARAARLNDWLEGLERRLLTLSTSPSVLKALTAFPPAEVDTQGLAAVQHTLNWFWSQYGWLEACALMSASGSVTVLRGDKRFIPVALPSAVGAGESPLPGMLELGGIYLTGNRAVLDAGMLIADSGVRLVCRVDVGETINPILMDSSGLGYSGESYLVGLDTVMLTPSRFHEHPLPLTHKMPIPPVLKGLRGESGLMVYEGFLNEQVLGAFSWLSGPRWVLVTEMRTAEAYQPLRTFTRNSALAAAVALGLLLIALILLARAWTRPIERLAQASERVAAGDFTVQVPGEDRRDEAGVLTRQFNAMVKAIEQSRSDLERSHHRLLQSEKLAAIGRLAAAIVHEMRNPLSAIKMNIRILQRQTAPNEGALQHLALAAGETDRLERMLAELLSFSKPPNVKREAIRADLPIAEALRQTAPLAERLRIAQTVALPAEPPSLIGDFEMVMRILTNLLTNALQASMPGGEVRLELTADENLVGYIISDKGYGMNERVQERLFDPFFTTRDEGIGLGMSNVKKFVDALDGRIEVISREGRGTKVSVFFPREANG